MNLDLLNFIVFCVIAIPISLVVGHCVCSYDGLDYQDEYR